jgi:hypothetical protein
MLSVLEKDCLMKFFTSAFSGEKKCLVPWLMACNLSLNFQILSISKLNLSAVSSGTSYPDFGPGAGHIEKSNPARGGRGHRKMKHSLS